jgi:hypothetical protein
VRLRLARRLSRISGVINVETTLEPCVLSRVLTDLHHALLDLIAVECSGALPVKSYIALVEGVGASVNEACERVGV